MPSPGTAIWGNRPLFDRPHRFAVTVEHNEMFCLVSNVTALMVLRHVMSWQDRRRRRVVVPNPVMKRSESATSCPSCVEADYAFAEQIVPESMTREIVRRRSTGKYT